MTPLHRYWAAAVVALTVGLGHSMRASAAACFTPLADPAFRKSTDFQDLAKNTAGRKVDKADGVVEFLSLETTTPTVANIDFYHIRFARHRTKTLEQVFKDLRLHFNTFAEGKAKDFGFGAYGDKDSSVRKKNTKLWESDDPSNALMSFNLDTLWPATKKGAIAAYVIKQAGDLQVTCATKTDFIFSTVESDNGGPHPVSGNRGFGIKDNGDDTWTFYSKAVDRETPFWKNKVAKGLGKDVFCLGHGFWLLFFGEMKKYLNREGMNVTGEPWFKNHGPVPFPFKPDPQPDTKECK